MEYINKYMLVEKLPGKVAVLTMNNPPLNPNTMDSIDEMRDALRKLSRDDEVNAIVFTGSGTRAFNVGTDLNVWDYAMEDFVVRKFRSECEVLNDLQLSNKPIIAAIEGYCIGGGLELASACHFRYMSETSIVKAPEVDLGVYCASGGNMRLPNIVGMEKCLEMLLEGGKYTAQECLEMGLVSKLFPAGTVKQAAIDFATRIAAKPPKAVQMTVRSCREFYHKDPEKCLHKNFEYIDDVFYDYNATEGVHSFIEKREPKFKV